MSHNILTNVTIGNSVRGRATFRLDGDLIDGAVTARIINPSGLITSLTVTNPAVGTYDAIVVINKSGNWYLEFHFSGIGECVIVSKIVGDTDRFV